MKLNINFNRKLEKIINLNQSLADWFDRNQELMAYFELIHKDCLHYENNSQASMDIIVLGRMANAALTWLELEEIKATPKQKAKNAAIAMHQVYEAEKERLSENARSLYFIDIQTLGKNIEAAKSLRM